MYIASFPGFTAPERARIAWLYTQNFSLGRRLIFREFRGFVAIREGFFAKFGGVASLARQKRTIRESFLRENRIFHQFAQVSPSKVSPVRYSLVFII